MKSTYLLKYLFFYFCFAAITIFGILEFWPSDVRPNSFIYIIFYICYLEFLIFIFPALFDSNKTQGQISFFVVLSNFITLYIFLSIILLIIGIYFSTYSSNLIYILTIGFSVLFAFFIYLYQNLIDSEENLNLDYEKNKSLKKKVVNKFNLLFISLKDSSKLFDPADFDSIFEELDIVKNRIDNMQIGKTNSEIAEIDNSILENIKKINSYIDDLKNKNLDSKQAFQSIINELNKQKENLNYRKDLLKV